ncbi:MAG: hypothetical protein ABI846_01985 [Rudaea sp.]
MSFVAFASAADFSSAPASTGDAGADIFFAAVEVSGDEPAEQPAIVASTNTAPQAL